MDSKPDFRLSKQRKVILEELRSVDTHPTADEVYDMVRKILPRISLGTVYRNLEFLCSKGLAIKVGPAGAQKRFDGNPAPHHHLRCSICNKVVDLPLDLRMPELTPEQAQGFSLQGVNVEYVGICPNCRAKTN